MTKKEVQEKTQFKVKQIKELCDKLQIRLVANNAIVQGNIIKPIVYFDDQVCESNVFVDGGVYCENFCISEW